MNFRPPALAVFVLECALPVSDRDDIVGDLLQTYADRCECGRRWNRLWFVGQTLLFALLWRTRWRRAQPIEQRSAPMTMWWSSVRQASRRLRHDWRYALGVVAILGVGLGPAAALLSVFQTVLMRPLDYVEPDRLAMVRIDLGQLKGHPGLSPDEARDLRTWDVFEAVEAERRVAEVSLGPPESMVTVSQVLITPGMLPMLGVTPILGRTLVDADVPAPATGQSGQVAAPPAPIPVLLDFQFWQSHFGGDATVLGRVVQVNGRASEIVGVLPDNFRLATGRSIPQRIDIYTPFRLANFPFRNAWQFPTLARLRPGKSFAEVQAALDGRIPALKAQFPEFYDGDLRFTVTPVLEDMTASLKPAFRTAILAVLLLLVIACANATALIVARLRLRETDLAIRQAMGAGRGALALQVLMESVLIAGAAAVVGALLAVLTVSGIRVVIPRTVPRWDQIAVGWSLLGYAALLAFGGLLAAGTGLVWRVSRSPMVLALRAGSAQGGKAEGTTSRLLLAGTQMALTVVLAFGCLQLARSAVALGRVDPGFDPNVLTLRVPFDNSLYSGDEARSRLYQRIRDRVAEVPGVTAVGVTTHVPLSGSTMMDGYEADLSKEVSFEQSANYQGVTPGYFASLKIPILQGRDFTDVEDAANLPVVVVDETLVRAVFPGETNVIGHTLRLGWGLPNSTIVGVVGHVRSIEIDREVRPQIYATIGGLFQREGGIVTVRTTDDPMAARAAVERAIAEVGPGRAIGKVAVLKDNVDAAQSTLRAMTGLVVTLALAAALLSAAGLYAVVAFIVHERRRSAAIRAALGASGRQVTWHYLRSGGIVTAVAVCLGLLLSLGAASMVSDLLYGVAARDLVSLAGASAVTIVIAGIALLVPARRAARANIVKVLREA